MTENYKSFIVTHIIRGNPSLKVNWYKYLRLIHE